MISISKNVQKKLNRSGSDSSVRTGVSGKPTLLLIAASTGSKVRNKAFGIRLPLLGYPAIALGMILALTPDQFHIQLVDEANEPVPYGKGGNLALIVGLTHQMPNAYFISDRLRSEGTKVILGGMHVTALPDEALMHADSIIVGEAESVWGEILDDFIKGSLKKKYSGREVNLAELPPMRRDLFNKKFYYPGQMIETTRGCSVGCVFCGAQNFFGTRFRVRARARPGMTGCWAKSPCFSYLFRPAILR